MWSGALVRGILVVSGVVSVTVGLVGIFVPLLPTTVFLLIGAACFARSSDRLHAWLVGHRWFGPLIHGYREHRAMPRRTKLVSIAMLWLTIGYAIVTAADTPAPRIAMAAVAVGVTAHLLRLRTLTPEMHRA